MLAVFLDQETTGLDPLKHRTIEIAFKIVDVSTNDIISSYCSVVKQPESVWGDRDRTSITINGFTWDQVVQGKTVDIVSSEIIKLLNSFNFLRGSAVFVCQNPSFDRGFFNHIVGVDVQEKMQWPYHWLDLASMYWASRMLQTKISNVPFPREIILSKDEIARFYDLPPESKPHKAMNGVDHLLQCYNALFNTPSKLPF